jgi:AhpD family alkylhydroperoxidase
MTRIDGAQAKWNKPLLRLVYWMTRRHIREVTERDTERAIEPAEVYGHLPGLLIGYGMFVNAAEKTSGVDQRLKGLAVVKAATLTHCEYCIDIASSAARKGGLSDAQLLALPRYRESDRFSALEKLVLDYSVGMTRTPVDVPDELFAALREHFDERQLVELTSAIAIENLHARFNAALDIGAAGFTEGMVCAVPDTSLESGAADKPAGESARIPDGSAVAT